MRRPNLSAKGGASLSHLSLSLGEEGSAFLSDDDVARITGYRHSKKVMSVLKDLSIPYILNARGRPLVLRSSIDAAQAPKGSGALKRPTKKEWRPL